MQDSRVRHRAHPAQSSVPDAEPVPASEVCMGILLCVQVGSFVHPHVVLQLISEMN